MAAKSKDTESEDEILLTNVHWGYLNGWRTLRDGKRVKTESWQTFWVDLSGPTLRLYRDVSINSDATKSAPPADGNAPREEDLQKAAFFSLREGGVEILSEEELRPKKPKQAEHGRVNRRHLFRVLLPKINSAFVFQAPSRSSLLRWVAKIQEGIDQGENHELVAEADERLRKVKSLMKKSRSHEDMSAKRATDYGSAESLLRENKLTAEQYKKIKDLKLLLQKKYLMLDQLEKQEKDFLGSLDGQDISEEPFEGTLCIDYCLVPGRLETYVPQGAKVYIGGRLPSRRWRCFVDKSEIEGIDLLECISNRKVDTRSILGKKLNVDQGNGSALLIERSDSNASTMSRLRTDSDVSSASKVTTSSEISISDTLSTTPVYDGSYPLIGCLPASAIEELLMKEGTLKGPKFSSAAAKGSDNSRTQQEKEVDEHIMSLGTPPTSPPLSGEDGFMSPPEEEFTAAPYSPHKRKLSSAAKRFQNKHVIKHSHTFNGHDITNNNTLKGSTLSREGINPFQNLPNRLTLSKVDKRGIIESLSSDEENDACELSDEALFWPRGGSIRQKIQERTQSFRKEIEKLGFQGRSSTMAPGMAMKHTANKQKGKTLSELERKKALPKLSDSLFVSDTEGLFKNPVSRSHERLNEENEAEKTLQQLGVTLRSGKDNFIIRGKLRQKGISIIIGDSSSSEEEEEGEERAGDSRSVKGEEENEPKGENEVFEKILKSPRETPVMEDHNSNELHPTADIRESLSDLTLSSFTSSEEKVGRVTSGLDLVSEFSQNENDEFTELEIERPRSLGHSVGFELPPPKNTRRKLKLFKQKNKGFGFRLTTYRFVREDEQVEISNFVSYVEDEGPAYIAGLRPGDIIMEVDDKGVDDIDHKELTKLVSEFETEMIVVVKFTNEGKRNELLVEVGNRQAKLKHMIDEYNRVCQMEKSVKKYTSECNDFTDSSSDLASQVDDVAKQFSEEFKSLYREVVIWTSKFQKESNDVLHSIQETVFSGQSLKSKRGQTLGMNSTTGNDLLYIYSSAAGLHDIASKHLGDDGRDMVTGSLKNFSTLDGFNKRQSLRTLSLDDRSLTTTFHGSSTSSFGDTFGNHVQLRPKRSVSPRSLERSKRHQSYKLAVDPSSSDMQAQEANIDYI